MSEIICENPECKNKKEMELNMPLHGVMFTADTCMKCGLQLHENADMFSAILKARAKVRDINIPIEEKDGGEKTLLSLYEK